MATDALDTQTVLCYPSKEGMKEMFLFNDALNTFYLRLYGVGHMLKDHSDSERGNPLPPHGLPFLCKSKGSFITIPHFFRILWYLIVIHTRWVKSNRKKVFL